MFGLVRCACGLSLCLLFRFGSQIPPCELSVLACVHVVCACASVQGLCTAKNMTQDLGQDLDHLAMPMAARAHYMQ